MVGVESRIVATFEFVGQRLSHILEGGAILHVVVIDAVNFGGFFGDVDAGVDAKCFGVLVAVRLYDYVGYLHDSVVGDTYSCCLEVKYDQGFAKVQFH